MSIKPLDYVNRQLSRFIRGRLWLKVLSGMLLGTLTGISIGPGLGWVDHQTANTLSNWLTLPGQLFLTSVQMIVIPLVFAFVVRGPGALEPEPQSEAL